MNLQSIAAVTFLLSLLPSYVLAQQPTTHQQKNAEQRTTPVPVQSVVVLTPSNSRISFVGIHVGDDPKPRLGEFSEFHGYAVVDPGDNSIDSIELDINVSSVWTQFEKLTGHLKNSDFFDTAKFPAAKFVSTAIKTTNDSQSTITGDLTLHGQTRTISFPARYRFEDGGLVLEAKFKLDRSQFGMDQMLSGVEKIVEVEIFVGQQTKSSKAQPGHGGESKKEQSKTSPENNLRQVSINLPNMT